MLCIYKNEINTMYRIEIKTQDIAVYRLAFVCASVVCLFALTAASFAATDPTDANDTYVDSVYSWGIWELDLEPASGPQAPATNAINDRSRRLQFRPNDNAAYMTNSVAVPSLSTITPEPSVPVIPSLPTTPLSPAGPPGFTSGPPTTADPRK